jgi:hypothetical protein
MHTRKNYGLALMAVTALMGAMTASADDERARVDAAKFDARGRLLIPESFDDWVFLGSSLGMGYSQASFDPDSPGMFQIVRMEPTAWAVFTETGEFPDGTMFSLHFYGSQGNHSINRAGFVMGGLHFAEIHMKDSERFPDGFNFFNIENGQKVSEAIAVPNDCITCHQRDGAYDNVFVQFYPLVQQHLPEAVKAKLDSMGAGGH